MKAQGSRNDPWLCVRPALARHRGLLASSCTCMKTTPKSGQARRGLDGAQRGMALNFIGHGNGWSAGKKKTAQQLGISLANIGRTQDACDTLAALKERYPNAPPTILQRADRQRTDLGC